MLNSSQLQNLKKELLNLVKTRIGIMSVDVDDVLLHHISSIDAFLLTQYPLSYNLDNLICRDLLVEKVVFRHNEKPENTSTIILDALAYMHSVENA